MRPFRGVLSDESAQALERRVEGRVQAELVICWHEALKTKWGRRLVYNLVFERGRIEAESFEFAIKDGLCSALHMARNEGIREFAIQLSRDLQQLFPMEWMTMINERSAELLEEATAREQARTSATSDRDDE